MLQCTPHHERIGEGNSHHAISRVGRRHGAGVGSCELSIALSATRSSFGGVTNRAFPLLIMSDGDDSAALWKVNRTIHELVKDRVQQNLS